MQDLRFAVRQLLKNPGFTAVAVLTLALGIGATTIVFSIVNGVLLQPLEYPGSGRIVNVWESDPKRGFQNYGGYTSPANFVDWRRENQVFEAIAFAAHHHGWMTLSFIHTGDGPAARLLGRFVSTNYFKVFGLDPILGRSFLPEEEVRGARRVVVISHRLWQRLYNGNPEIVGKSITLENQGRHTYEIIGVMPPGFRFPGADLWVSCAHMPRPMTLRGGGGMHVVARLKPGVSLERAQAEMTAIQARIHAEYSHLERGEQPAMGSQVRLQPLLDSMVGYVRSSLMVFSGAVALVLLIACANVANLLLSRSVARQREMAVRAALGASRWRIVRQLLCESVALSLLGGVAGTLCAHWGTQLVVRFNAGSIPRIEMVGIDFRVFLFAIVAALVTGILFGLAPAWQSSRTDLHQALKEGTQRLSSGLAHGRLRSALTVTQIALALVLLIGAGLLMRSFNRLQNVQIGFDTDELLTVEIAMMGASYETMGHRCVFLRRLMDAMEAMPGVESVSAVSMVPDRPAWSHAYARMDRPLPPLSERGRAAVRTTTPGFLKTYGIPLLRGRDFAESDAPQAEKVILINQAFADKAFPGEDPLGKLIHFEGQSRQVVGVFGNVKNTGLAGETQPEILVNYQQWGFLSMFLTVRAKSNPMALAPIVTDHVRTLNPDQPLNYFQTMKTIVEATTARPRFRSLLLGWFALVALLLASVGIYGVMAYSVRQRTNEMGIRMALGAQKSDVMKLVLRQGLNLALVGAAIGLAGSLALTRVLKAHLFGISTTDLTTYLGVSILLMLVALVACLIPALRAMRVNPMEALRYE